MLMDTRSTSTPAYPLSLAAEGERVQVVKITGGQQLLRSLFAMGITDGIELEVIHSQSANGVVVRCLDSRWALGRGMAHKVLVTSVQEQK